MILKIGGKDFKGSVSYGKLKKSSKKREKAKKKGDENNPDLLIYDIWLCLDRKWGVKPYIFKWRMVNKITPKEMEKAGYNIADEMSVEDREGKNLPE